MIRNVEPRVCPVGALAFYLFHRFEVKHEPFPVLNRRCDWYCVRLTAHLYISVCLTADAHRSVSISLCVRMRVLRYDLFLFPGRDAGVSYKTEHNAISKAFAAVGVIAKKKTHMGRGAGAQLAEEMGASTSQIGRAGRWNAGAGALENSYLTSLPREAMRAVAGFPVTQGAYFIRREILPPPEALQKKVLAVRLFFLPQMFFKCYIYIYINIYMKCEHGDRISSRSLRPQKQRCDLDDWTSTIH